MSGDTYKTMNSIADMVTLSNKLKTQSEEVECELCASILLLASVILKDQAIEMQNKLLKSLELKIGVKFERCEIENYIDEK